MQNLLGYFVDCSKAVLVAMLVLVDFVPIFGFLVDPNHFRLAVDPNFLAGFVGPNYFALADSILVVPVVLADSILVVPVVLADSILVVPVVPVALADSILVVPVVLADSIRFLLAVLVVLADSILVVPVALADSIPVVPVALADSILVVPVALADSIPVVPVVLADSIRFLLAVLVVLLDYHIVAESLDFAFLSYSIGLIIGVFELTYYFCGLLHGFSAAFKFVPVVVELHFAYVGYSFDFVEQPFVQAAAVEELMDHQKISLGLDCCQYWRQNLDQVDWHKDLSSESSYWLLDWQNCFEVGLDLIGNCFDYYSYLYIINFNVFQFYYLFIMLQVTCLLNLQQNSNMQPHELLYVFDLHLNFKRHISHILCTVPTFSDSFPQLTIPCLMTHFNLSQKSLQPTYSFHHLTIASSQMIQMRILDSHYHILNLLCILILISTLDVCCCCYKVSVTSYSFFDKWNNWERLLRSIVTEVNDKAGLRIIEDSDKISLNNGQSFFFVIGSIFLGKLCDLMRKFFDVRLGDLYRLYLISKLIISFNKLIQNIIFEEAATMSSSKQKQPLNLTIPSSKKTQTQPHNQAQISTPKNSTTSLSHMIQTGLQPNKNLPPKPTSTSRSKINSTQQQIQSIQLQPQIQTQSQSLPGSKKKVQSSLYKKIQIYSPAYSYAVDQ